MTMRSTLPLLVLAIALALGVPAGAQDPAPDSFEGRLQAIDIEVGKQQASAERLEEQYLALLEGDLTPEQKGIVYVHIARIGWRGPQGADVWDAYNQEALSYPLPDVETALVYSGWAHGLRSLYFEWRGPRWVVGRRRIADVALRGLRFVLDKGAPRERVDGPAVDMMSVAEPSKADIARHEAQMAARKRADDLDMLRQVRAGLSRLCAEIYAEPPTDPEELRARATAALEGYPEAVQDIMDMLDANLKRRRGE